MRERRETAGVRGAALSGLLVVALALHVSAPAAAAQIRPLDPLDWHAFDDQGRSFEAALGIGVYLDQRASLAGTEGRLLELGNFRATWTAGQVAVQLSGTAVRVFEDERRFAEPYGQARPLSEHSRVDAGDYRVSTIIRLAPGTGNPDVALRFGVRLPTTDNGDGLERDQTDFFTTVGGRYWAGNLFVSGELGVGVLGTRNPAHEQVDPILFAADLTWDLGWIQPELEVVGQHDPRRNPDLRGNEDLGEVRLAVRKGERRWVRLAMARGWETFSPGLGLFLEGGFLY